MQNTERCLLVSRNELREIENIDAKDLDVLIANFLLQVRKKDGEQYEATPLRSFVASFDCYLRKKDYSSTIMEWKELKKTKEALVTKQKELKKEGKGNKPNAARMLTHEEVKIFCMAKIYSNALHQRLSLKLYG